MKYSLPTFFFVVVVLEVGLVAAKHNASFVTPSSSMFSPSLSVVPTKQAGKSTSVSTKHAVTSTSVPLSTTSIASKSSKSSVKSATSKDISPTQHTSAIPSSSPTPKPTTKPTPKPTPKPIPQFVYKNPKDDTICVAVKGHIVLEQAVFNDSVKNSSGQVLTRNVTLNETKNVQGGCFTNETKSSYIIVSYGRTIVFGLRFNFTDKGWYLSVTLAIMNSDLGSTSAKRTFEQDENSDIFKAPSKKSYSCDANSTLELYGKEGNITVYFDHLKIQPMDLGNKTLFQNAVDCAADEKKSDDGNSIVPIAVGCALAGFIVIVLIAYLIGRRKSNKGYQKV